MTMSAGVSRWTMLHLGTAVVMFLAAQLLLSAGHADPIGAPRAPETLMAVHLITIGWLALMMLGALYQFVPVITNSHLFSQRLPVIAYAAIVIGLCGMVAGFAALGGGEMTPLICLPIGGTLVLIGFVLGAFNIAATLWRAYPFPLQAWFVAIGLGFLLFTGGIGLCFALAFSLPAPSSWLLAITRDGLTVHVAAGLGGWFTLTAMGVSYRLLSMFMLAPEEARASTYAALSLTPSGLLIVMAAVLVTGGNPSGDALAIGGGGMAGLGIVFYLADMVRLFRTRKRRHLELNSIAAAAAIMALGVSVLAAIVALATGRFGQYQSAIVYLFLFGWLSGLGLSQLYKIIPFLTWLEVFGKRLGKGPVPRVQDLVNEPRARRWFILYFASVLVATAAISIADARIFVIACYAQLVATALIGFELWQARHPDPNAKPKPVSAAASALLSRPGQTRPQPHGDRPHVRFTHHS
jgi:hypothetical protein